MVDQDGRVVLDHRAVGEPECARLLDFLLGSSSAVAPPAECAGELHGGQPDPASNGMHEDCFAGPQRRLRDQRVVGGDERLRHGRGIVPRHFGGDPRQLALVRDGKLRVPAASDDSEHTIADGPSGDAASELCDLTSDFESRDVRGRAGRCRIASLPLHEIRAIQRGRVHPHQHFAVSRKRTGNVEDLENLRTARSGDDGRAHA